EKNDGETPYEIASLVDASNSQDAAQELATSTDSTVNSWHLDADKSSGKWVLTADLPAAHVEEVMKAIEERPIENIGDYIIGYHKYIEAGGFRRSSKMNNYLRDFKDDLIAAGDADERRGALAKFISLTGKAGLLLFSKSSGAEYDIELEGDQYLTGKAGRRILEEQLTIIETHAEQAVMGDPGIDVLDVFHRAGELEVHLVHKINHVSDERNYPELPPKLRDTEVGRSERFLERTRAAKNQLDKAKRERRLRTDRDGLLAGAGSSSLEYKHEDSRYHNEASAKALANQDQGWSWSRPLLEDEDSLKAEVDVSRMEWEERLHDEHKSPLEEMLSETEINGGGLGGTNRGGLSTNTMSLKTQIDVMEGTVTEALASANELLKKVEGHREVHLEYGDGFPPMQKWVEDHEMDFWGDWKSEGGYRDANWDYDFARSSIANGKKEELRVLELRALENPTSGDINKEIHALTLAFGSYSEAKEDLYEASDFYEQINNEYDWAPTVRYRY
ncbi:MAG: hypothetical protein HN348_11000, partial [Proteobacteria bacterium]|nr:hypothetical protein [Pseudomonadota bacterium]